MSQGPPIMEGATTRAVQNRRHPTARGSSFRNGSALKGSVARVPIPGTVVAGEGPVEGQAGAVFATLVSADAASIRF